MSWATSSASLFSKPSPLSLEKGRLLGSPQTRRSLSEALGASALCGSPPAPARSRKPRMKAQDRQIMRLLSITRSVGLWERKDQQAAAAAGIGGEVLHGADEAQCPIAQARIELGIGDGAWP